MGKYFTDSEIDAFLKAYLEKYPDAIARMHFVMNHPFRDNDEQMARYAREVRQIADSLSFFHEYSNSLPEGLLKEVPDRYYHAYYHLQHDVTRRVAEMLGHIGSYEIEE
jgi:plasmid stabilization system protein ParE